jgi:hypothetical protein
VCMDASVFLRSALKRGLTPYGVSFGRPDPLRVYTHKQTPAPEGVGDERPVAASGAAAEHRGAQRRIATAEARNERVLQRHAQECC